MNYYLYSIANNDPSNVRLVHSIGMTRSFESTEPMFTSQHALESLKGWQQSEGKAKTRNWRKVCRAHARYWEHYLAKYYPLSKWNGKLLT